MMDGEEENLEGHILSAQGIYVKTVRLFFVDGLDAMKFSGAMDIIINCDEPNKILVARRRWNDAR